MIRINLLPHRAEKRKRRLIQFGALSAVSVIFGLVAWGVVHFAISARIDYQERRNNFLRGEIAKLDRQIEEIRKLREQVKSLMARKEVVENLQATRSDVVHLMDQMLRILPEGVYLKSLRQTGDQISIVGLAQSNARVSTLMRSIQNSPWFTPPTLVEIHSVTGKERQYEFSMVYNLTRRQLPAASPGKGAGALPANPSGAPGAVAPALGAPTGVGTPAPAPGAVSQGSPGSAPAMPAAGSGKAGAGQAVPQGGPGLANKKN